MGGWQQIGRLVEVRDDAVVYVVTIVVNNFSTKLDDIMHQAKPQADNLPRDFPAIRYDGH
jgi:hypothetical protein